MDANRRIAIVSTLFILHIVLFYTVSRYYDILALSITNIASLDITYLFIYFSIVFFIPFTMTLIVISTTRSFILTLLYIFLVANSLTYLWKSIGGCLGDILFLGLPTIIIPSMIAPLILYTMYNMFSHRRVTEELLNYLISLKNTKIDTLNSLSNTALLFTITGFILYILDYLNTLHLILPVRASLYIYGVFINILISIPLMIIVSAKTLIIPITLAIIAPFSWITTPLYPVLTTLVGYREKVAGKGVFIGLSKAILEYNIPVNMYREINQEPLIGSSKGKTWYWRKHVEPVTIDPYSNPNPHISIFGASGTGKSSLAKTIIYQLYRNHGVNFLIIDHHNEYLDLVEYLGGEVNILDAEKAAINPLDLEGRSPRQRAIELADIIQSIFSLGYIQRNTVEEIIIETYRRKGILEDNESTWSIPAPTFYDVLRTLDDLIETSPSDQYRALLKRIRPYIRMLLSNVFLETRISLTELLSKPTIILLATLPSDQARALYLDTLLYKIINAMYQMGYRRTAIVVDEAHHLFRRTRSKALISRLLMESRKYGLCLIVIVQQPLDVNESVILNTYIRTVFNIREHRNLDYIARSITGYTLQSTINAIKLAVANLPKHYSILNIGDKLLIVDTKPALISYERD